ncbi:hypothetical protein XH98_20635 [Bradyrhizobium sp. CCBAU 51745]|uniref:ATP-binding protein n=1 Tax=Bradyrhizobium sp. CCBAU 51745 TaxID=1325099 RepID=UPI002306CED6|nr:ATP-binding protein [Bradyrhizobium sp. CCBAU 51745]MDA9441452.1 hypothetical protein [Bradyrhizobium sp. CCBAU 51745]
MKAPRGFDKPLFQKLVVGEWVDRDQNLLIIDPTGVSNSWIASALGHKACRDNRYARILRTLRASAVISRASTSVGTGASIAAIVTSPLCE